MSPKLSGRACITLLLFLLVIILSSMIGLQSNPAITLIVCLVFTAIFGKSRGFSWAFMEQAMLQGVGDCLKAIFILAIIGMLIATWMLSGTVPSLFYWGLELISPERFLLTALFATILVSTFTGSSLTTAGTVGVALMAIAKSFGIPPGYAAGAIICGSCFGDKLSPLSDTTNLAPGIVGVDLFTHVRHLLWTTVPALSLTVLYFAFLTHTSQTGYDRMAIEATIQALQDAFTISPLTLLSPLLVLLLALKRHPTLPTLIWGILSGLLTAGCVQNHWDLAQWMDSLQNGFHLETPNPMLNSIINRGGLMPMMFPIALVIIALAFGGLLQGLGLIATLMQSLQRKLKRQGDMIASAAISAASINFLTGEQYLSILLPGQAFKAIFKHHRLPLANLSRTLEDAGTLVNPLVPWGVSGAFFASALQISVSAYLPHVVFLYLSPLFTIALGYLNIGCRPRD